MQKQITIKEVRPVKSGTDRNGKPYTVYLITDEAGFKFADTYSYKWPDMLGKTITENFREVVDGQYKKYVIDRPKKPSSDDVMRVLNLIWDEVQEIKKIVSGPLGPTDDLQY